MIIVNDQIRLTEVRPSDEAACVEHLREKEIYEHTMRIPFPYTEADFQFWLKLIDDAAKQQGRPVHWAIRDEHNRLIGNCGLEFQPGVTHRAELGYWLAKPYWSRGIVTAAVRALCGYAFVEFGLTKIVAHCFANNVGSANVLQKCGFQQEGFLRKHFMKNGRLINALLFGLLKE